MPTDKQKLGNFGEETVVKNCLCFGCKKRSTFKALPTNFKCADIVCDFCGFLAQVKACTVADLTRVPMRIPGAAWGPQKERMDAAIYFPLYIVLVRGKAFSIYYLSADLQKPEMFIMRNPLSETAKRAGWQGFMYDLSQIPSGAIVKVY